MRSRVTARSWVTTIGRQAELGHQAAQQIEESGLDRDVEAAGRLVHEDQPRPGDEVTGDLQPLLHAAGEGLGQIVDPIGRDLDVAEPLERGGTDLPVVPGADAP